MAERENSAHRRQRKAAALRAEQQRQERRRRLLVIGGSAVVAIALLAGIAIAVAAGGSSSPSASSSQSTLINGALGPEGIALENGPDLASLDKAANGQIVDGVQCQSAEQVAYHIHARLQVVVNGDARRIPLGIGVVEPQLSQTDTGPLAGATQCYYWLHTHATDGIVHIESPTKKPYTLGTFFAIWGQPLSRTQVGPAKGDVTAFVNGKKYSGALSTIELSEHEVVQLDVGEPVVPFADVDWSQSLL
jgi:hypothetical protein